MSKYGQTWWGKQWLNSLERIDFSNRLPRGRTYANKGAVQSIVIDGNTVKARVQGSMRLPYKVEIVVPVFRNSQIRELMELIHTHPLVLAALLNKELNPGLDQLAKEKGIEIFPRTWRDFQMSCSCPDYAVPCKHLAAVLNIMANEVDRNPFVLFQLHGFDLLKELGTLISSSNLSKIPMIESLVGSETVQIRTIDRQKLSEIDMTMLAVDAIPLVNLLPDHPPFYHKNFKELIQKTIDSASRFIDKLAVDPDFESASANYLFDSQVAIRFSKDFEKFYATLHIDGVSEQLSFNDLVSRLQTIEVKTLEIIDQSWQALHKVFMFSLRLISYGLYIPHLYQNNNNCYFLFYEPALMNRNVNQVFDLIHAAISDDLIGIGNGGDDVCSSSFANSKNGLSILCSLFIGYWLRRCYEHDKLPSAWDDAKMNASLGDLFLYGYSNKFSSFETASIPLSIYQWLSVFDIHQRHYDIYIQVEEVGTRFGLSMLVGNGDVGKSPVQLKRILDGKEYEALRLELLKDLNLMGNYMAQINQMVASGGLDNPVLDTSDFSVLLVNVLPLMKVFGVKVLLPKSLRDLVRPQLMIKIKRSDAAKVSVRSLVGIENLLDYNWQVTLGNESIDAKQFLEMVKGLKGLVKIRDQYVFLDDDEIKSLQKNLDKNNQLSSVQILQAALAEEVNGIKAGLGADVVTLITEIMKADAPTLPQGINATLRPYQLRGFEWLVQNARLGLGPIIADDMGLGKTLQVISFLLHQKEQGLLDKKKALIVVPTSLITNWMREVARFAPGLSVGYYHGSSRNDDFRQFDVVLTSYGMVRNSRDVFDRQKWYVVVIDEAQNIKNHTTEQSKSIKKLKSDYRIAMSGTPVENRLSEYWSIFDFVQKGYLGSYKSFNDDFAKPIHLSHDMERINHFKRMTAPFLLRRVKTDRSIISDLPDKVEANHLSVLTTRQAALYQNLVDEAFIQLKAVEGIERKGLVLKLMMALKQVGNHPVQYLKTGDFITSDSGKSQLLISLVSNILESNEKVLIFTQFREMGHLIQKMIEDSFGEKSLFLHGGCTRKQRDEMVDRFQNGNRRVFILSLKAGGTGLNLTAASHVVHYDLWWNPAVESQATDRAYRIGQQKNVMVYRLINTGTLEEKIDRMIQEKRQLADLTVAAGETWLGNLTNDEIKELVRLE